MAYRPSLVSWAVVTVLLAGCGAATTPISPQDSGASQDVSVDTAAPWDVPADSPSCVLPNGSRCAAGTSCPAGDGCNVCACPAGGGLAMCTLQDCPRPDAGTACRSATDCPRGYCRFPSDRCVDVGVCDLQTPCFRPETFCACDGTTYESCEPNRPTRWVGPCEAADAGPGPDVLPPGGCYSDRDCGAGVQECVFSEVSCGLAGTCQGITDCALIVTYCGCDGTDFMACPGRPTRQSRGRGSCSIPDAGVVDAGPGCVGAHFGRDGRTCVGPDDRALPNTCCFGWQCDTRLAACDSLPPACPAGETNTVAGACWGPCVPPANCAPIACGSSSDCPRGWGCAAGRCAPPR